MIVFALCFVCAVFVFVLPVQTIEARLTFVLEGRAASELPERSLCEGDVRFIDPHAHATPAPPWW